MKSIRLSLIVYFLVLLAVALGAVMVTVYQTTQRTLRKKDEDAQRSLKGRYTSRLKVEQARFDRRKQAELNRLDDVLLRRAQQLSNVASSPRNSSGFRVLAPMGLLGAGLSPHGHVLMPAWLGRLFWLFVPGEIQ